MIVPDVTPYSGPHPVAIYNKMMSLVDQRSSFRPYSTAPPATVGPPPALTRSPTRLICSSSDYYRESTFLNRPEFATSQHSDLHTRHRLDLRPGQRNELKSSIPSKLNTPAFSLEASSKSATAVSPISTDGGSGTSPFSEVSHLAVSSEDGDEGSGDSRGREDGDRKAFKCPQCMYFTDRKNNLKRHIVTMHQECSKTLECCGVVFHSKATLRDHVGLFHRGGYRCQICSRNFCRKALLRRHLTVHSGRKDFSCDLCGYATSHKSNLERHQKVHLRRPVCQTSQDNVNTQLLSAITTEDRSGRYYAKFRRPREKPVNRFVLLPNRLKYTHNIKSRSDSSKMSYPGFLRLKQSNVRNGLPQVDMDDNSRILDDQQTYTQTRSKIVSPYTDTENIVTEVDSHSTTSHKRTSCLSKPAILSSRKRIFITPYKCSDCYQCFSKQADFHGHVCLKRHKTPDDGLSVITAVRKGHIKLLPQQDPSNGNSSCEMQPTKKYLAKENE